MLVGSLIWYNCKKEAYDLEEAEMMMKKDAEKENTMKCEGNKMTNEVSDPDAAEKVRTSYDRSIRVHIVI